jgi:hypothetical protein
VFGSTEAAYITLNAKPDLAQDFFSRVIDPSIDTQFAMPEAPQLNHQPMHNEEGWAPTPNAEFDDNDITYKPGRHCSDLLLFNSIILLCDLLYYWEFCESIHEGDIGRTFKVIHVCILTLLYFFSHTNFQVHALCSGFASSSLGLVPVTMAMSFFTKPLITGSTLMNRQRM